MPMPGTLCRSFRLTGKSGNKTTVLLDITDNRKRSYHLALDQAFEELTLTPLTSWGEGDRVRVVSFDFI